MGRITTTVYDALDRPTVVIDPMGDRTTTTYDADGEVARWKTRWAGSRPATYDDRGWVAEVDRPAGVDHDLLLHADRRRASPTQQGQSGGSGALRVLPTTPTTS